MQSRKSLIITEIEISILINDNAKTYLYLLLFASFEGLFYRLVKIPRTIFQGIQFLFHVKTFCFLSLTKFLFKGNIRDVSVIKTTLKKLIAVVTIWSLEAEDVQMLELHSS